MRPIPTMRLPSRRIARGQKRNQRVADSNLSPVLDSLRVLVGPSFDIRVLRISRLSDQPRPSSLIRHGVSPVSPGWCCSARARCCGTRCPVGWTCRTRSLYHPTPGQISPVEIQRRTIVLRDHCVWVKSDSSGATYNPSLAGSSCWPGCSPPASCWLCSIPRSSAISWIPLNKELPWTRSVH